MPEREFELYLSLLGRFLRLKPAQLDAIADELRDHLELRLEELAARGLARDAAIHQALDELGDAAGLASRFTQIAQVQRRRRVMRFTLGSVVTMLAAFFIVAGLWPKPPQMDVRVAQADQDPAVGGQGDTPAGGEAANPTGEITSPRDDVEIKLAASLASIEFQDQPLTDVAEFISESAKVDILFDTQALANEGVSTDQPVTLRLRHTQVSAKTALELILEPLGLAYVIRDGIVFVTPIDHAKEIKVYNVQDLELQFDASPSNGRSEWLRMQPHHSHVLALEGALESASLSDPEIADLDPLDEHRLKITAKKAGATQLQLTLKEEVGPVRIVTLDVRDVHAPRRGGASSLAEVVRDTIEPTSWHEYQGNGSIVEFNGLLIVDNKRSVHQQLERLLEMLRSSMNAEGG